MSDRTLSDPRVVVSHPDRNGTPSERWLRRVNRRTLHIAENPLPAWEKVTRMVAGLGVFSTLIVASLAMPGFVAGASAQRVIAIASPKRTASVQVAVGKSQDVRTDAPFVDITVGDADIADVNPLTDHSLSVLGKKIGTTRVSVYGEGKKLVGIFDVEVSYDVSRLAEEIAHRFPGSRLRCC